MAKKTQKAGCKRAFFTFERRRSLAGFLFILPFVIGLFGLYFYSLIMSLVFSVNETIPGTTGYSLEFVGLKYYYHALFEDPEFIRIELTTMASLIGEMVVVVIYALFIAVMLNKKMKGRGVIRAIFFLPVVIATGILAKNSGASVFGAVSEASQAAGSDFFTSEGMEAILSSVQISPKFIEFITSAANSISYIVNHSGVQMIILLAGLQSVSPAIYEAASVEGCTGWESFWKITLPMISPLIRVCTVWTIIDYYLNPSNAIMSKLFGAFGTNNYSIASAMAWINFLGMAVVVGIVMLVLSKFVFYEDK